METLYSLFHNGGRIRKSSLFLILSSWILLHDGLVLAESHIHHHFHGDTSMTHISSSSLNVLSDITGGFVESNSATTATSSSSSSSSTSTTNTTHNPIHSPTHSAGSTSSSRLVEVYEHEFYSKANQIWIGGTGTSKNNTSVSRWSSTSLPNDKVKHLPPPSELSPPKGYKYEGEWMIDMTSERKDELGWEYYLDEKGEEKIGRRRRRWLRTVVKKQPEVHASREGVDGERNVPLAQTSIHVPNIYPKYHLPHKVYVLFQPFRDSFNFKGYGLSLYKSLIYPSFGFTLRMPITTHFDIFEMRPYIPSIATSMSFSCRPYKLVLNLNCSLPVEVIKTIWWIVLDWTMWMFKIVMSLLETVVIDLIWKIVCINCIGKVLELGQKFLHGIMRSSDSGHQRTNDSFHPKKGHRAEDVVLISRHGATILGRQYPKIPSKRSIIYSQNTVQRLGITAAMHLSHEKGLEFRYSWWNTYFSTVEYYQSVIKSWLKGITFPTLTAPALLQTYLFHLQQREQMKQLNIRLLNALFGIIWGGFTPEAPYYTCTAMLSMSGFYSIYGSESLKHLIQIMNHKEKQQKYNSSGWDESKNVDDVHNKISTKFDSSLGRVDVEQRQSTKKITA